jgi:hypothetical protein
MTPPPLPIGCFTLATAFSQARALLAPGEVRDPAAVVDHGQLPVPSIDRTGHDRRQRRLRIRALLDPVEQHRPNARQ